MGLDGFSMGNLGLNPELTSAQMSSQAEHLAQKESEFKIKDVTHLAEDKGVKRKEEEESNQHFNDGFKEKKEDEEEDYDNDEEEIAQEENFNRIQDYSPSHLSEKEFEEKNPKDFYIRINAETEMVELVNNKDGRILETINANDLMGVISNLNSASGILVNRKI